MDAWGLGPADDTFAALERAWNEQHRHYHDARHLQHCLALLDRWRDGAGDPGAVEMALWFHDAVYNPHAGDNEARSARWAVEFLTALGAPAARTATVEALILATTHDRTPATPDEALLLDIDLAVLGGEPTAYAQYERDVRAEYRWVPGPLFRRARAKILQGFLDRPVLYHHAAARDTLEARARANLRAALGRHAER